jgi:shikimate dehydrogenase
MQPTSIGTSTRICAVIGNPIAHSLSPAIHNAAFEALGLDFVYLAFRVDDLKNAVAGVRALENFRGLSVTIPHKVEMIRYMDEVAEVDRRIGSINTVIREGDKLVGLGTDGLGAMKAITDAGVELKNTRVLMLGSGGAARAISFTLVQKAGLARLAILGVEEPELSALAADLKAESRNPVAAEVLTDASLAAHVKGADLIIHCTPVGMHPNEDKSIVPAKLLTPGQAVLDIVYNPLQTRLVKEAKERGLTVIPGVEMFINQAVLQFTRFTETEAPVKVMRRVVMDRLAGSERNGR